jgi:hypothetical protein
MVHRKRINRLAKLESLERRQQMAGDVSALLEGQLLKIEGDNLSNQVVVAQNALGHVTVTGQNGTRINGQTAIRFLNPQLNAMEIRMEGGDDAVTLRGLQLTNDLFANLGAGNDLLTTVATSPVRVGANAQIEGGEGTDTIRLSGISTSEDLYIDGGLGVLNASLTAANVDKALTIIGDEANDIVTLSQVSVGDSLSIETKGGADRVSLTDAFAFKLSINTDANGVGADQVNLTRVTALEDIGIFTGAGNDVARLTDVQSGKSLVVSTDSGNDRVVATRVTVAEDAIFEGGAGVDRLEDYGIFAGVKKEIKEFESLIS